MGAPNGAKKYKPISWAASDYCGYADMKGAIRSLPPSLAVRRAVHSAVLRAKFPNLPHFEREAARGATCAGWEVAQGTASWTARPHRCANQ